MNNLYALGQGYSTEYTAGTLDLLITMYSSTMTFVKMVNFGGINPDYAADITIFASSLLIVGHSQS